MAFRGADVFPRNVDSAAQIPDWQLRGGTYRKPDFSGVVLNTFPRNSFATVKTNLPPILTVSARDFPVALCPPERVRVV